jgi:nitroreductase
MEFMDVVRKRRSIRRFKPDPVPEEEIKYILEAARLPGSARASRDSLFFA